MHRYLIISMKLQKQLSRKVGKTSYYKYVLVLSQTIVRKAGFGAGEEIEAEPRKGKIILKRKK